MKADTGVFHAVVPIYIMSEFTIISETFFPGADREHSTMLYGSFYHSDLPAMVWLAFDLCCQ